ncbi:hypothetical protein [Roseibium sp.]|uniref:hypothetical protein n=1 Tax=Roseibium sp. TaxID=1936156 RepID=UPI0032979625
MAISGWEAAIARTRLFGDTKAMHPFPDASKLQFLLGSELEQIGLGMWQIQLHFDFAHVCIGGDLEHADKTGVVRRHNTDKDRLAPILLHHLLGQKITEVEVEPFRLTLGFTGGDSLRIFSDEGPYECGQIYDKDGAITVF